MGGRDRGARPPPSSYRGGLSVAGRKLRGLTCSGFPVQWREVTAGGCRGGGTGQGPSTQTSVTRTEENPCVPTADGGAGQRGGQRRLTGTEGVNFPGFLPASLRASCRGRLGPGFARRVGRSQESQARAGSLHANVLPLWAVRGAEGG